MQLAAFLNSLRESGHVRVPPPGPLEVGDSADVASVLVAMDAAARLEAAFQPPLLSQPAATWAAEMFYRGCQFLIYRDVDEKTVREELARPCPEPPSARTCYSVDLVFQYLPDLLAMARGIAEGDPLVEALLAMARAWPLSSVGVPAVGQVDVSAFWDDASLRRLYVDRMIDRDDVSRLADERVADAVREALGLYPSLAPSMAEAGSLEVNGE